MTQSQLASALSVTQGTVAKWESGSVRPDPEGTHSICFALGASAEEVTALSCARGADRETPSRDRAMFRSGQPPPDLREVILLGMEADCWWAATKDPSAEMFLCDARTERAKWYLQNGRLSEVEAPARAALKLARNEDCRLSCTGSVWALFQLAVRRGESEAPFELMKSWTEAVKHPSHVGWVLALMAQCCAKDYRQVEALEYANRAIDLAASDPADRRNRIIDLAEIHLTLGNPDEALETIELEDRFQAEVTRLHAGDFEGLRTRARAILACGELPGADVMDNLRAAVHALPTLRYRQSLDEIEKSYRAVSDRLNR